MGGDAFLTICLSRIETSHWFHRFHTGSLGSTRHWFHRFQTGSRQVPDRFLGSATLWVQQVPYRFLRFNRGTMGILADVNFGNCPNYVLLNAPLCRTFFGMGGDAFLTGMPVTNRNQPLPSWRHLVQPTATQQLHTFCIHLLGFQP